MLLKEDFLHFSREEVMAHHEGGKGLVFTRRQKQEQEKSLGQSLYLGFHGKNKEEPSNYLTLANVNNSDGLGSIGVVSSCLALSDLEQGECWLVV